jgi:hypothetical protein
LSCSHGADHEIRIRNGIFDTRGDSHGLPRGGAAWSAVGDREENVPRREARQTTPSEVDGKRLPDFAESQQTNLQTHPRLHT